MKKRTFLVFVIFLFLFGCEDENNKEGQGSSDSKSSVIEDNIEEESSNDESKEDEEESGKSVEQETAVVKSEDNDEDSDFNYDELDVSTKLEIFKSTFEPEYSVEFDEEQQAFIFEPIQEDTLEEMSMYYNDYHSAENGEHAEDWELYMNMFTDYSKDIIGDYKLILMSEDTILFIAENGEVVEGIEKRGEKLEEGETEINSNAEGSLTEFESSTVDILDSYFTTENFVEANVYFDSEHTAFVIEIVEGEAKNFYTALLTNIMVDQESNPLWDTFVSDAVATSLDISNEEKGYTLMIKFEGSDSNVIEVLDGEIIYDIVNDELLNVNQ
ncbi:hypothetical protein [Oceanobacillus oncorhynchi]|uniref:hypothetical protein n=1 Tax=Oceanobacillus oncorhynchi TaxID=545501 RepID=UPI0034D41CB6